MNAALEVVQDLDAACQAFNAFMTLLTSGADSVSPEELFFLLQPIQEKIDSARSAAHLVQEEANHAIHEA